MILDWLISIPGESFITLFLIYSTLIIGISRYLIIKDTTKNLELPKISKLDPYTIAFLKENWQGTVRLAVFNLISSKLIEIRQGTFSIFNIKSDKVLKTEIKKEIRNPIEKIVYAFVGSGRAINSFFKTTIHNHLSSTLSPIRKFLISQRLIRNASDERRIVLIRRICYALIFILGGTKLILGIIRDKPILYLVFILMIVGFIMIRLLNSNDKKTDLGRRYLKSLEEKFETAKEKIKSNGTIEDSNSSLYVALFGTSILAGIAGYEAYANSNFRNQSPLGTGGGCGGSGCGGSGCGGGGCGGGCGGCGG